MRKVVVPLFIPLTMVTYVIQDYFWFYTSADVSALLSR